MPPAVVEKETAPSRAPLGLVETVRQSFVSGLALPADAAQAFVALSIASPNAFIWVPKTCPDCFIQSSMGPEAALTASNCEAIAAVAVSCIF